ncbi:hypothetical protein JNUCC1_02211 [Lentibacillus sp. JNUCC-1]|uniref:SDR family oxidoreductase n=1 Tax=Lentibacillus sp. JNUCC-1 TaxID=2654513 RepID=UPI0013263400|nr:SDR family oxidoreductase [Lentibacillus sp. JNUCC-1]MUV38373.1 hypothetical protein [Lentibacillus sp. JNUCC-1]
MPKVLVAGATGYLGKHLVQTFKKEGYNVRALVRNEQKLSKTGPFLEPAVDHLVDDVWVGDVTESESIKGVCEGVDFVCSAVGLTRQKGSLTFHDVDYQGNLHLLHEAQKENVGKFMYIHVCGDRQMNNPIVNAKSAFVRELRNSGLNYIVVKPTGYFSDMTEYLKMAQKGRVFLRDKGENRVNPIHGEDLADFCVSALREHDDTVLEVGGPHEYRHAEIGAIAFGVLRKKERYFNIPAPLLLVLLPVLKIFNKKQYALGKFFLDIMTKDILARAYGRKNLSDYFLEYLEADKKS